MESLEAAIRCGKIHKHTLAIFLLLPGSWDLITYLEKGLHFLLNEGPKAQTYPCFLAGLFLIAMFPETGTENVKKVFPKLACQPETS